MKEIPNKIYIDEDLINYHCLTYRCDGDLEYIRKDVLLEWVKLAYGKVSMNPFDCSEAFDELIGKIELL